MTEKHILTYVYTTSKVVDSFAENAGIKQMEAAK